MPVLVLGSALDANCRRVCARCRQLTAASLLAGWQARKGRTTKRQAELGPALQVGSIERVDEWWLAGSALLGARVTARQSRSGNKLAQGSPG